MIKPKFQDEAFLDSIKQASQDASHLHLWWLGQSGFLVQFQNKHLLIDPYLSDALTQKYAATSKPHVRMTERVVCPEKLNFIDVVTSSHNHTDHLDAETLLPLMQVNLDLKIVVSKANLEFAANRLRVSPERLTPIRQSQPLKLESFTLYAIPAAHEDLETDPEGNHTCIGFIIQAGDYTIYHSGDTMLYEGMVEKLKQWHIDIAILPINGRDPKRGVAGNLSGPQAIKLAKSIEAKLVIPCHYDMFEFNTVSPQDFIQEAEQKGQAYKILQNGEGLTL